MEIVQVRNSNFPCPSELCDVCLLSCIDNFNSAGKAGTRVQFEFNNNSSKCGVQSDLYKW